MSEEVSCERELTLRRKVEKQAGLLGEQGLWRLDICSLLLLHVLCSGYASLASDPSNIKWASLSGQWFSALASHWGHQRSFLKNTSNAQTPFPEF